ncbi:RCC1 domain-containing protein [Planotetraspora mira]|uniref:RCC1-like domain-containing protein n=1 Tax=Planotetraspora mira TaxID=58121 RepID=A0A8J3TLI2_9ACTN|nr:RCC1 domain-containing protein [Planotetraspora mira]GII27971.1 hypothetical protein Pmi06nite_14130 [Planotetraspora mira]
MTLAALIVGTASSPASAAQAIRVKSWGANGSGQLGDATTTERHTPVTAAGVTAADVTAVSGGLNFSLALLQNGTIEAWGNDTLGQLGDGASGVGANKLTPGTVTGLLSVRSIAAGSEFGLARLSNGSVQAWGDNDNGQLGNGAMVDSPVPVTVVGVGGVGVLSNVKAIAGGGVHALALLNTNTVRAWGNNGSGQLGNGVAGPDSPTPVTVLGVGGVGVLSDVALIAAGGLHTIAYQINGPVNTWGSNLLGQLGDGSTTSRNTPIGIPTGLLGIESIAGGGSFSLAA